MREFLDSIPLTGWLPVLTLAAIALLFLILAVVWWRRRKTLRWVAAAFSLIFAALTVGDAVNSKYAYFDTMADLLNVPTYPTADDGAVNTTQEQPNGLVMDLKVADTESNFGNFDAKVFLPPQYFTDRQRRFPVAILSHGNPGFVTDWLTAGAAAQTGLEVAKQDLPVILVMPEVLQTGTEKVSALTLSRKATPKRTS
jgi:hypothetical protein